MEKRGRGRPVGSSSRGEITRQVLYETAIGMFAEKGYEASTMRAIAAHADVSPGLLYRYFPSKRAVVLALYDSLSAELAAEVEGMPDGPWAERFNFALRTSLEVLGPHRRTLSALLPVLVSDREQGLFARATAFSRKRVEKAFVEAVVDSNDPPENAQGLGRLLYIFHLVVLLAWLLDRSPERRASTRLTDLVCRTVELASAAFMLPFVGSLLLEMDDALSDLTLDVDVEI